MPTEVKIYSNGNCWLTLDVCMQHKVLINTQITLDSQRQETMTQLFEQVQCIRTGIDNHSMIGNLAYQALIAFFESEFLKGCNYNKHGTIGDFFLV